MKDVNLILQIVYRFMRSPSVRVSLTTWASVFGIALGVGCMIAAMAGFSGFEMTLRNSVTDFVGHILVMKRGEKIEEIDELNARIRKILPETVATTPFAQLEGIVAGSGKVSFVMLLGVDVKTAGGVLNLKQRLIRGEGLTGSKKGPLPEALIGRGISEKYGLNPGDTVQVVLPNPAVLDSSNFTPKVQPFTVAGVLDLSKHDLNERYIVTNLPDLQKFGEMGSKVSGLRLRVVDEAAAPALSFKLSQELGYPYVAYNWKGLNENLFTAIQMEKMVIFFVLLIMVIAASFNVSTTLYISVLRRYPDISILQTMGLGPRKVRAIFQNYGLFIATLGIVIGLVFGVVLIYGFVILQGHFTVLPPDVYKLDHIDPDFRILDILMVIIATYLVCLISTLAPARRGSQLDPVEGLRYE